MRLAWLVAPALACVAVGCGSTGGTKAGGRPLTHPIMLSIANHETEGRDLAEYVAAVDRLSGGSIQLERHERWRSALADYDRATVADVRAGRIDIAKIAVRSLDTVGVTAFQPLMAPFLVDSVALERTVLASRLADEMLAGLARAGVVGVAVVPGEPRRPFGQRRRFVAQSAYRGALFGIGPSNLSRETLEALGARPRTYVPGNLPYAFNGAELDLATIEGQGDATSVTSLIGNVVLWPRAFVVVANGEVFASLTAQQREILRTAGREALAPAISRLRIEERDEASILCRRDQLTLLKATKREFAELRAAVRPVYATLERSAVTRARIRRIESMKRRLPPAPPVRCALSQARQRSTTPLDGTWEMTADARYGIDAGRYRLVLRHGHWRFDHLSAPKWGGAGVFSVRGDNTLRVHFGDGSDAFYRWNVFRETLTLRYTSEHLGAPNPTLAPWHRVGR
jgi:TRAP-type C4-dicarboxylate transport system substrate-binding protein